MKLFVLAILSAVVTAVLAGCAGDVGLGPAHVGLSVAPPVAPAYYRPAYYQPGYYYSTRWHRRGVW